MVTFQNFLYTTKYYQLMSSQIKAICMLLYSFNLVYSSKKNWTSFVIRSLLYIKIDVLQLCAVLKTVLRVRTEFILVLLLLLKQTSFS